jgi:Lon protease-like protein
MNVIYRGPSDLPSVLPLFPLPGALLLPRGQMPLNIFEPRYLAMIDEALRTHRLIGMIQPDGDATLLARSSDLFNVGCAGRITQFAETGDNRYIITLTGVCRFRIEDELTSVTPFRQSQIRYDEFVTDLEAHAGESDVDRGAVLSALREFSQANGLSIDWKGIDAASNEALVNALSMMAPFGIREKQALLEAKDLKTRAELLVAITQIELARRDDGSDSLLQ